MRFCFRSEFILGKPVKVQLIIEVLAFGEVNEANMVSWMSSLVTNML